METTFCDLCGSEKATPAVTSKDYLLCRSDETTHFVKCARCGLIYQNPRPTLEEMAYHYPSHYESFSLHPDDAGASWLLRKAIHYGLWKRRRLITRRRQPGRVLDVGSATGIFLRAMHQDRNWEAYGVEPNQYAAQVARSLYGLNVYTGTLEQAAFPDGYFDAVTLWDVLEHLHKPSATLAEIHRILTDDGLLIVRVPNGSSWDARLFGGTWSGYDSPRHLFVFTPDTLEELLTKSLFKLQEIRCRSGSYPTFLLSLRFWLRGKGAPAGLTVALTKALYHPVMRLLASPVFFLPGLAGRGPLITAVACKNGSTR